MHHGLFLSDDKITDGDYEVNLLGVAVRVRNGRAFLVEDVAVENEDVDPGTGRDCRVAAEVGKKHAPGELVRDDGRRGYWIVHQKHAARLKRQLMTERATALANAMVKEN